MAQIVLLRHGQASFGAADYDELSDLGRQQASLAGEVLARRGLRAPRLVSGGLRRQRDTAALAAAAMGVDEDVAIDGRFDEYDHVGMVVAAQDPAGGPAAPPTDARAFQLILDRALADWVTADAEDGWRSFAGGAVAAVEQLASSLGSGRDAVVATSGGVIAAICARLLGAAPETVVALNRVTVNASFTTLIAGRQGLNLLSFNDHAHLTGDAAHMRTYR